MMYVCAYGEVLHLLLVPGSVCRWPLEAVSSEGVRLETNAVGPRGI